VKASSPPPEYPFRYEAPPPSGNRINGLGEPARRRPVPVFHGSGRRELEWAALELYFLLTMPLRLFWRGLVSRWLLRRADGPVAPRREPVTDPVLAGEAIKAKAKALGAAAAGICPLPESALYEGYTPDLPHAVAIAGRMDFEEMEYVTELRGGLETMRAYIATTRIAVELAEHIRGLGWNARAYCESADILHIPIAIAAGIGELGKHGSLINRELGSNFRLATVLTEMPLGFDAPVDIGADDLCHGCQRCTIDCPADAISDRKQLVRGVEKWYVDFDRCVPYFTKTYGCGICIQVCPWSKPGRGPSLSAKLLAKRHRSGVKNGVRSDFRKMGSDQTFGF